MPGMPAVKGVEVARTTSHDSVNARYTLTIAYCKKVIERLRKPWLFTYERSSSITSIPSTTPRRCKNENSVSKSVEPTPKLPQTIVT